MQVLPPALSGAEEHLFHISCKKSLTLSMNRTPAQNCCY